MALKSRVGAPKATPGLVTCWDSQDLGQSPTHGCDSLGWQDTRQHRSGEKAHVVKSGRGHMRPPGVPPQGHTGCPENTHAHCLPGEAPQRPRGWACVHLLPGTRPNPDSQKEGRCSSYTLLSARTAWARGSHSYRGIVRTLPDPCSQTPARGQPTF